MSDTLYFFTYYATLLLLGGILISGWFKITRGEWYVNPDETPYWSGMLFSGWQRFWEQPGVPNKERFYFKGTQLQEIVMSIEPLIGFKNMYSFVHGGPTTQPSGITCISVLHSNKTYYEKHKHYAEIPLKIGSFIKPGEKDGEFLIFFYKDYPTYRFPKWVRSPIASCIYCHGSIYGSLVWWIPAIVFHPFDWSLLFIFWIPFLISQSFVSPFLNKQL